MLKLRPSADKYIINIKKKKTKKRMQLVVKNLPCDARDMISIPGRGTKIPYASEQLNPRGATTEPMPGNENSCMMQQRS